MGNDRSDPAELKRSIGLVGMVFYGVGTIVGGGIYALLGKMIGAVGVFTPLSLMIAGAVALVSALSFAEMSRRFPASEGEVAYVDAAFGWRRLSQLVGTLVILTGVVSAATLCAATGGFLLDITGVPALGMIVLTAVVLTAIAAWGVSQSVAAVALVTILEVGTLVVIILLSADSLTAVPRLLSQMTGQWDQLEGAALMTTAFLAFYAFVGFEDMVNMAEEVRDVERTLPLAILISVAITFVLYLGVAAVALNLEDREALAQSNTPMALLLPPDHTAGITIGVISILAGLNGALVQIVMAARVLYGMARKGMAPGRLGAVSTATRTPLFATLMVGATVLLLAVSFPLVGLAQATSFIILGVFALVNLSLVVLRRREGGIPWLPGIAAAGCVAMLTLRLAAL